MIHNSEQASVGWSDFPRPMQSAEVAKLSPEACWLVVGEGEPWSGEEGDKSTVCGVFSRVQSPLNGCRMSILGLLPSPRQQGGLCPAEMLFSFVELPLCGETCL